MPLPIIGAIGVIGGVIAKSLSVEVIKFIATRALLYGLFTLVLPIVIYNVLIRIYREGMEYIAGQTGTIETTGYIIELTGMAGWIADRINLIQCMSLVLSAYAIRFLISFIKR